MNDAMMPAKIAQKAEVMPNTENGVAATASAANAPNLSIRLKAVSRALCRAERMATPASVTTNERRRIAVRQALAAFL